MHVIDWYPTLVKPAGLPLTQELPLDGRDIWPVLTQGAKSPHDALLLVGREPSVAAVRMGDWKLLVNPYDKHNSKGVTLKEGTILCLLENQPHLKPNNHPQSNSEKQFSEVPECNIPRQLPLPSCCCCR